MKGPGAAARANSLESGRGRTAPGLLMELPVNAHRLRPTEPHLPPLVPLRLASEDEPDCSCHELAALAVKLCDRLERLRHVVAVRLAREGRQLAALLHEAPEVGASRTALLSDLLTFQARARDLLAGSR